MKYKLPNNYELSGSPRGYRIISKTVFGTAMISLILIVIALMLEGGFAFLLWLLGPIQVTGVIGIIGIITQIYNHKYNLDAHDEMKMLIGIVICLGPGIVALLAYATHLI